MKKIILFCSILFFVTVQLCAQIQGKAVDYFIYKIAEGSLLATKKGAEKEKDFRATFQHGEDNPPTFQEIQKEFDVKGKIKAPKTLEMLESLHKFLETNKKILTFVYLTETIFDQEIYNQFDQKNSFHSLVKAMNGDPENRHFKATEWKDKLTASLATYFPDVQKDEKEDLTIRNNNLPKAPPHSSPTAQTNSGYLIFLLPFLALLVGFALGWIAQMLINKKKSNHFEEEIKIIRENELNLKKQEQQEIKRLKGIIADYKNEVEKLRTMRSTSESAAPQSAQVQIPAPINNLHYFPSPDSQGRFPASWGKDFFDETSSIYEITIHEAASEATFRIAPSDRAQKLALSQFESIVKPVSHEPENLRQPSTTRIQTEVPGRAQLKDGYWIVTQKAKIRYD
jgi:hypothetical protein